MDELTRHLQTLFAKPSWLSGPRRRDRVAAAKAVAELGTPFTAGQAFPVLFDDDEDVAFEIANTIAGLMDRVRPIEWTRLYPSFQHLNVSTPDVARLASFPAETAVHLLGIASLNHSGHVRQASLERLGKLCLRESLPYVILRLADWVPQVRAVAAQVLDQVLAKGQFGDLLKHSSLINWLSKVERVDLTDVRRKIIDALCSTQTPQEAMAAVQGAEPRLRLMCYDMLASRSGQEQGMVEQALRDPLMEVRSWGLRRLLHLRPPEMAAHLRRLLHDKAGKVRAAALRSMPNELWDALEREAIPMIWDDSASVRETARFYLARRGVGDFAGRSRRQLETGSQVTPGLISCSCEAGTADDFDCILPFCRHSKPRVREAVVAGLAKLDAAKSVDPAISALSDSNARVRRAAIGVLRRAGAHQARVKTLAVLAEENTKAQVAALAVLSELGGWEAFRDILWA